MPPQATININANVSPAQAAIQKLINQQYNLNLNLSTKGGQPLGKITGQVSEFNKSLDAANARVVAFGASATVLFGLNKAFEALVTSTIEVQKSLADINVILNVSDKQINQFGSSLFNVAKNTGQSFQEVAKAATEFSRQGLGVEETLKRTSEALILSRLSGLDTVKSVEALTAAVNSFASQSVTATQIVNKFATVDAAFAVSSADLAEAISRVGSSASQSGVQLDELIGLVTSAQQTTARGGAVIGNSFKTIFTRLQRGKVIDLLGSLGIETTNASGELRSTIDLLKDLGKVYDTLGSQQQASVAEAVGGVFQINILKAALADLGKEYSVYNNAVQISSTATNEAITRNDQLNKTLAAQINALKQNATQFAAKSGESLFGPALENLVGGGNSLLESLNNVDSESVGGKIGNGILKGIGDIIAGPGLALIGGVLLKLFGDFAKFSGDSVKQLLGLNSASSQQQGIQSSISAILAKNPQYLQQMASGAISVNQASQVLLTVLQQQTVQMQQQATLTSQISKNLYNAGVRVPKGSQTPVTTKAAGYIPNFVDPYAMEEAQAKALGARSPRAQLSKGTIGGKKFIKNSEELEIPRFGKNGDSAVIPMYGRGYIPNFAPQGMQERLAKSREKQFAKNAGRGGYGRGVASSDIKNTPFYNSPPIPLGNQSKIGLIHAEVGGGLIKDLPGKFRDPSSGQRYSVGVQTAGINLPAGAEKKELSIESIVETKLVEATSDFINKLFPNNKAGVAKEDLLKVNAGAVKGAVGNAFETAITLATKSNIGRSQIAGVDFESVNPELRNIFYGIGSDVLEAKYSKNLVDSVAEKGYTKGYFNNLIQKNQPKLKKTAASGYIPNFANALNESISREIGAGVPRSGIYTKQYSQLASSSNPLGIGVFNKRDEGTRQKEKSAMSRRGYATGYIPNFAEGDAGGSDIGKTVAAVGIQLTSFAGLMAFQIPQIKSSYQEEITTRKAALVATVQEEGNQRRKVLYEEVAKKREAIKQLNSTQVAERQQLEAEIKQRRADAVKEKASAKKNVKAIEAGGAEVLSKESRRGAKLQAASGGLATVASFAPIIAETVASGIDTSTKEGRTKSAAVTGIGTVGAYAGTGALVGSVVPGLGTAAGAGIGALVGGAVALSSVIKEMGTNLPELNAAIKKTSEEQSRLGEATGRVLPLLEQLQQLRESGNADSKEAADLERQIREIASTAPEAVQKAISAGGLDFTETNKRLAELNATMSKRLSKQEAQGRAGSIFQDFKDDKIKPEDFVQKITQQAVAGKTNEELAELQKKFAEASVSSAELTDALSLTREDFNTLEYKEVVDKTTQAFLDSIIKERQIRLDGAKGTAKDFATKNAEAVKALQDFEASLRKAIQAADISTKIGIATSGAAFGSEFKRLKSTGDVGILEALGFDKAASDLQTKNIFQDTVGMQKTESSAVVDEAIKQALNTAFLEAIPSTTGIKDANQYNEKLTELSKLSGATGDEDFSQKIQAKSSSIGMLASKPTPGPLGILPQFDSDDITSQLKANGVKAEELVKVQETIKTQNQLIFSSQKDLAKQTVGRIDELIKVTITGLSNLGGSIDDMLNDGGMGDGSASEKFSDATADYLATMKDPKATAEQKGQAARDLLKSQQKLGMEVKTSDPQYQVLQSALAQIGESQRKSIEANLQKLGQGGQYNARVAQLGGIEKAAAVKTSTDIRPVDANSSQLIAGIIEPLRTKMAGEISQLGLEGKSMAEIYTAASEMAKAAPAGTEGLGEIFNSQITTSNSYLESMVSILREMQGMNPEPKADVFNKFAGPSLARTYLDLTDTNEQSVLNPAADSPGSSRASAIQAVLDPRESFAYKGDVGPTNVNRAFPMMQNISQPSTDYIKGIFEPQPIPQSPQATEKAAAQAAAQGSIGMPAPLNVNAPITISINAASQAQGQQVDAALQGVDQEVISLINNRLSKVESITAAAVNRDPSLTPAPRGPTAGLTQSQVQAASLAATNFLPGGTMAANLATKAIGLFN
jgi:TP901 family phage tail tape measure protein